MDSLLSAQFLRIRRHWFTWVLLFLWIIVVIIQVNGKIARVAELESTIIATQAAGELSDFEENIFERDVFEFSYLRSSLRIPEVIGFSAKLASDIGWFLVILYTAVIGGEDFSRRTLRSFLTRGVSSTRYLITLCSVLWLSVGFALVIISGLATIFRVFTSLNEPILIEFLGDALLLLLRSWISYLPFIIATLFWVVLARQAGSAMGVGIGLHALEYLNSFVLPIVAITVFNGGDFPAIYRWSVRVFSISIGYNADVFLYWGSPFLRSYLGVTTPPPLPETFELGRGTLLPTMPSRAILFLLGYSVLFLGWAIWILRRRDETYIT